VVRSGPPRLRGERTRARILSAARREFARGGFAGARIEAIARRAGVNKSLIFYYFQNKDGLSRAVTAQRLATYALPRAEGAAARDDLFQWPMWLFGRGEETLDAVRFALSEGIGAASSSACLVEEDSRRESFQQQVARVWQEQQAGDLPNGLDARQLTFFLYTLGVYPYLLPQGAYLITGAAPDDVDFRRRFETFIRELARALRPEAASEAPALN
jgi:AcrR family transcriptional regulator